MIADILFKKDKYKKKRGNWMLGSVNNNCETIKGWGGMIIIKMIYLTSINNSNN